MKIKNAAAVHVSIPLETPYVFGRGTMTHFDNVVVRIETGDGIIGFGESAPLFRSHNGDAAHIARMLNEQVSPKLVGEDPMDIERLITLVLRTCDGNVDAAAGVDVALHDIVGKYLNQPIYRLLGGKCQDPILVDYTIGSESPEAMAATARLVTEQGFSGVVVKVTGKSAELGIAQVRSVRDALSADHNVRIDCNGGFSRDDALAFIKGIADLDIEFVEQPVAAEDLEGSRSCRGHGIAISLDESLITLADAINVVRSEACDIFNVKVPRVGGFLLSKKMIAIADAVDKPVVVGGRTALEISRAASRHLAASSMRTIGYAHEGPGPASQALSDDVTAVRTSVEKTAQDGGRVWVEQGPGLGIDVVWDKVERYRVRS